MAQWAAFVGLTGVVCTLLLALARLSQHVVRGDDADATGSSDAPPSPPDRRRTDEIPRFVPPEAGADSTAERPLRADGELAATGAPGGHDPRADPTAGDLSTGTLLANVALTQGLFGGLLLAGAWYFGIPASAFGVTDAGLSTGLPALAVGVVLGVSLYAVNEIGAVSADAVGVEHDERLRSMLAPDTGSGWLVLLLVVLPIIAGVEEFIFRAAVIGATTAGFGTSVWALAVVSSLAFALGHGAQGRAGIVVTGSLGFVLAAAFILTGSFLVVFVAHYLVNALEFVVHELLGIEWAEKGVGG
ncbi:lysostaphin resistance A-like protein [Halorientalis pallida]|uniref:CPBP family intramembrane glutamic endopeptidase n=1 Tax=Halorientalis pallida TaxID=2479928 RepID=UPI003C6EE363